LQNDEFEEAYNEARAALHRRGKIVEMPTISHDGVRYCRVDGQPLTDRELLREAWGDGLTDEILRAQERAKAI
jgi:hypothetical protein